MHWITKFFTLLLVASGLSGNAQPTPPYKNRLLPTEQRVNDLLGRMNATEKFWQLFMIAGDLSNPKEDYQHGIFGFQVSATATENQQILSYAAGQRVQDRILQFNKIQRYFMDSTRLGIPVIFFDEALHGLVRSEATAFPQSIGLAATFDVPLMREVSTAIAAECQAAGIRQILSPVVNLATDVRWGRTEETYGEDPYLVSEMAVAYVQSFEKKGIITTPKHFVVNHGDGGKDSYPIHLSKRALDETYFVPFRACLEKGGSRSIMTAYNSLEGSPCTANDWLLNQILKQEWSFNGFVISDASATGGANVLHYTASDYADAGRKAIQNGLDVIFQTNYEHHKLFIAPFLDGTLKPEVIDAAVRRVLRAKFELGLFDQPYLDVREVQTQASKHQLIAKKAAMASMVLLKNQKQLLPLAPDTKVAVVGIDAVEARLGGYSGPGEHKVSILQALQQKIGPASFVGYEPGCGRSSYDFERVPASYLAHENNGRLVPGLKANYHNGIDPSGPIALSRIDKTIDFDWSLFSPDPAIDPDFYSVDWEGFIQTPEDFIGELGIVGNDGYQFYVDGQLLLDTWTETAYQSRFAAVHFQKNSKHRIKLLFKSPTGNVKLKLVLRDKKLDQSGVQIAAAKALVAKSEIGIVVVGINEGEFLDRSNLKLPGNQEKMILELAQTGKPLVVLLSGGSAVNMENWMDKVSTILQLWYPGEQGGPAVCEVLYGQYNPSGRLPFTYPRNEGHLPLNYNHKPTGRGDDYISESGLPLFPFGFGLSYTTFDYTALQLKPKQSDGKQPIVAEFTVTNTGKRAGTEIVQLYLRDELSSVARPIQELKGFQSVSLEAGESRKVQLTITPEMLELLDAKMQKVVEPGVFSVRIGSSSRDIRLRDKIEVITK